MVQNGSEKGDVGSMITTGKMLDKGEGTARDSKQAFYWFSKAAEKGSPEAEVQLGQLYYAGRGISADMKKAVSLLRPFGQTRQRFGSILDGLSLSSRKRGRKK